MSSQLIDYLENPHWRNLVNRSVKPVNGGCTLKRWVQGSVGGNSPAPISNTEYWYTYPKRGSNNVYSYEGGLMPFNGKFDEALNKRVQNCSRDTANPIGCQLNGVQELQTAIQNRRHTSHPFGVSYETGAHPRMCQIPPHGKPIH